MQSPAQRQVTFNIPFQVVQYGSLSIHLLYHFRMVIYIVQNSKPMPRRGFRIRAICPEFRQDPGIISPFNQLRFIRLSRNRIQRVPHPDISPIKKVVKSCVFREVAGELRKIDIANRPG